MMDVLLSLRHGLLLYLGLGYLTYLILWRCFLSPLTRLPGPKLAALTYWYECYYGTL